MSSKHIQYIALLLVVIGYIFFDIQPINQVSYEEDIVAEQTSDVPEGFFAVTKVVDGDTIKIDRNGNVETIRLIGVNTPETVDPRKEVQCFGKEASDYLSNLLHTSFVRIETDVTQDPEDRYGRMLAYVFTQDGVMVNKLLIEKGFAFEYTYNVPYQYQSQFKQAEQEARMAGVGMWAKDACKER